MSIQRASPGSFSAANETSAVRAAWVLSGDVVAAEHREGRGAGAATQIQRVGQIGPRGDIATRADEIGPHVGMVSVELAGDRVEEVAVTGDGQADDAGVGVGQRGTNRLAIVRCVVDGADRADHAGGLALMATLHDGVQPVLGRQHVFDVGGAQTDAGDSPLIGNARAGQVIEVDSLVGPVEVARADVYNAALQGGTVVGRHVDSL